MEQIYNIYLHTLVAGHFGTVEDKDRFIRTVKGTKEQVDAYLRKLNKNYPNAYANSWMEGYYAELATDNKHFVDLTLEK